MPSPFPGMDPFIEQQKWTSFHSRMIMELCDLLVAQLRPRYEIDPEDRIYVESIFDEPTTYRPDVVLRTKDEEVPIKSPAVLTGARIEPREYAWQVPQEQLEHFVVIRHPRGGEVVTVIELLSPSNKRTGSDGRREYMKKRNELLGSQVSLVEIDLLLGGLRLPTRPPLRPSTDYCCYISRARQFRVQVFEWSMRNPMPVVTIPLAQGDADTDLDLQHAFNAVYERGAYAEMLDYQEPLALPLRDPDATWIAALLQS